MKILRTHTRSGQYRPQLVAEGRAHTQHYGGKMPRGFSLRCDASTGERYTVEISEREFLRLWGAVSGADLLQAFVPEQAGIAYRFIQHFVEHPRDPGNSAPAQVSVNFHTSEDT